MAACQLKRLRFLRFSFTQRTQRMRLRLNGNRALHVQCSRCCYTADCEYGDKATWCATIGVTASRCTPSDLGTQCCATCDKLVPGGVQAQPTTPKPATNADCPEGDQASYCATIESFNCYAASKQCCVSCAKYKTNIAGMEPRRAVQTE